LESRGLLLRFSTSHTRNNKTKQAKFTGIYRADDTGFSIFNGSENNAGCLVQHERIATGYLIMINLPLQV